MYFLVYGKKSHGSLEVVQMSVNLDKREDLLARGIRLPIQNGNIFPVQGDKDFVILCRRLLEKEEGVCLRFFGSIGVRAVPSLEERKREIQERGGLMMALVE